MRITASQAAGLMVSFMLMSNICMASSFGVYQGNGCDGVRHLRAFSSWLGRQPDFVLDFFADDSWDSMLGDANWTIKCWARAQMKVVFSVPMLPRNDGTLAEGAVGRFDDHFRKLAQLLVAGGYGKSVIRLGWEFNGNWYPWAAGKDPASWIRYWRRIVTTMRAVDGAAFRFDWCSAQGHQQLPASDVYPGDDYVDIIGRDLYNQSWTPDVTTPQQRWHELLTQSYGLNWLHDFAIRHNKPMSLPEWGTGTRPDGHGGGDDAYFITHVMQWISQNNIVYHAYWDYHAKDYDARLSDGSKPRAAAAFRSALNKSSTSQYRGHLQ